MLVVTGTHGEKGLTGLMNSTLLDRSFYVSDCKGKKVAALFDEQELY